MKKIIIDSSYYNFYRFFATQRWYSYSDERRADAENRAWLDNPIFMKTFEKKWFETLNQLCKYFQVKMSDVLFVRDGAHCWRYDVYPEYKANRAGSAVDDIHSPGPVFKHVNENYHKKLYYNCAGVIRVDRAEGDDIAAVTVRYLQTVHPDWHIVLITGDHDFLQLSDPGHVDIYQLASKGIVKQISADDPHKALMTKVLCGDPSDNIPPIFKGCGKVTTARLIADPQELEKVLQTKGRERYDLNRLLVDLTRIPQDIVEEIEAILDTIF